METSTPCLSNLRRHTISIILSYLQQTPPASDQKTSHPIQPHNRDALSLLITTKRFAYAILPLFRVPRQVCHHYHYKLDDGSCIAIIEKYRFLVLPIQDPVTLLDRLNTKRLRRRILWAKKNSSRNEPAQNATKKSCYMYGRSTDELAVEEWTILQVNHDAKQKKGIEVKVWPAHLELLRFLDQYGSVHEAKNKLEQTNQSKRTAQLPFCLRPSMSKINNTIAISNNSGNAFRPGVVLLTSYPRSGNTLLRTLLERTTSIVTGSDTRPDRTLSKSLAMQYDLVGEGLVGKAIDEGTHEQSKQPSRAHMNLLHTAYDPSLSIVKTHFPERSGWKPVNSSRVLLLIRNPYDSIDSYWNLCCTNTHTTSLDESVYKKYANKFESLARHEIRIWCEFHYYWLDVCQKEGVPLLVVRYEDLVLDPESEMQRVIAFLKEEDGNGESLLDSFWKWRIRHALGKSNNQESSAANQKDSGSTSNLGSYQPRSSSGGILSIGKTLRKNRYSESTLTHMHDVAASGEVNRNNNTSKFASISSVNKTKKQQSNETLLQKFGYDIYNQNFPENFKQPPPVPTFAGKRNKNPGRVTINKTPEIRSKDDEFGRKMTLWRRGETDDDSNPFPTVAQRK